MVVPTGWITILFVPDSVWAENPFITGHTQTIAFVAEKGLKPLLPHRLPADVGPKVSNPSSHLWRNYPSVAAALACYGGLRCSSEVALLKWSDIHWDADWFTVTSAKNKWFGKSIRVVPLFSQLRNILDEV